MDKTESKIHEIYERFANSWEYNDIMMRNDSDIDWLLEKPDAENYRR